MVGDCGQLQFQFVHQLQVPLTLAVARTNYLIYGMELIIRQPEFIHILQPMQQDVIQWQH